MNTIVDIYRRIDDIHGSFIGYGIPARMKWNGDKWYMEGSGTSLSQIAGFSPFSKILLLIFFVLFGGVFVSLAPVAFVLAFVSNDFTGGDRVVSLLAVLLLLILGTGFLRRAWHLVLMLTGRE